MPVMPVMPLPKVPPLSSRQYRKNWYSLLYSGSISIFIQSVALVRISRIYFSIQLKKKFQGLSEEQKEALSKAYLTQSP